MRPAGTPARRHGGAGRRARAMLGLLAVPLCLSASVPAALRAQQVGHEPDRSPYRDIYTHQAFTVFVGRFAGNTAASKTGARPGFMAGARLAVQVSGAVDIWLTMGEVWTSRLQIDAGGTAFDTAKAVGDLKVRLMAADLSFALNLTGAKTWHGLAPYIGLGGGITAPTAKVVDPGGFELGTNFTIVPTIGTRVFITRSLALRLEARDYYFRYTFPLSFVTHPYAGHADFSPINSQSVGDRVWYNNFALWAGLTYGFNF